MTTEPKKRGTPVKFHGFSQPPPQGKTFRPVDKTYVWAWLEFPDMLRYIIEHPDGFDKKEFLNKQMGDEVVAYLSKSLMEGKKFIFCQDTDIEEITAEPKPKDPPPSLESLHNT